MKKRVMLALDIGSGSGRAVAGRFDGDRLEAEEIHRFENYCLDQNGHDLWDVLYLYRQVLESVGRGAAENPVSLGIDTWGTDFAFLDAGGQLLGNVECTRNTKSVGLRKALETVTAEELYSHTGQQMIPGATLFQLIERQLRQDPALANARRMHMLPDLLTHFLTGQGACERTVASTSLLYSPQSKSWNGGLLSRFGLPEYMMPPLCSAGEWSAPLRGSLCKQVGVKGLDCIAVATHDTASAVAAIPLKEGEAFCSLGTWALVGAELNKPLLTTQAMEAQFSNEEAAGGGVRFLKNTIGMWVIQQCRKEWLLEGGPGDWEDIQEQARRAEPFRSLVDLSRPEFTRTQGIIANLRQFCAQTGQPCPENPGQVARCVYESLALSIAAIVRQLEGVTGKSCKALWVAGGAVHNRLLCQMLADALSIPVQAGPAEAAAMGNILLQAAALGEVDGLKQIREVVSRSFEAVRYLPQNGPAWQEARDRHGELCHRSVTML